MKSTRTRRNKTRQFYNSGNSAINPTAWDVWLERLAHFSQPALLALGIFGYFYTVVPVFQNQQLQEQAAKLELEKSAAQTRLNKLTLAQSRIKEEINQLQIDRDKEKRLNAKLSYDIKGAKRKESEAERLSELSQAELQTQRQILDSARWELVMFDFGFAYTFQEFRSLNFFNIKYDTETGDFLTSADSTWPVPYENLIKALDTSMEKGRKDIPDNYYVELKNIIKSKEQQLQCKKPDFAEMKKEYLAKMATVGITTNVELQKSINNIKKEYEDKHQQVEITDEYREASKRKIRLGEVYKLNKEFQDRLLALKQACDSKGSQVISEINKQKDISR